MKTTVFTLISLIFLTGCLPMAANQKSSDLISSTSYIKDVWEYSNDDGQCSAGEWFGDSSNGCIKAAQLVRFADGSAFITLNLGTDPALQWAWSKYLLPNETTIDETLNLGRNVRFDLTGDISKDEPDLEMNYDHTKDLTDTPPVKIALVQVYVGDVKVDSPSDDCKDGKGNNKCNGEGSK